jgi:hypothetical protein
MIAIRSGTRDVSYSRTKDDPACLFRPKLFLMDNAKTKVAARRRTYWYVEGRATPKTTKIAGKSARLFDSNLSWLHRGVNLPDLIRTRFSGRRILPSKLEVVCRKCSKILLRLVSPNRQAAIPLKSDTFLNISLSPLRIYKSVFHSPKTSA